MRNDEKTRNGTVGFYLSNVKIVALSSTASAFEMLYVRKLLLLQQRACPNRNADMKMAGINPAIAEIALYDEPHAN
jgi:hypothetical protein